MNEKQITVLGVGNILFTDEGVGIRVVEALDEWYEFSPNVSLIDGGVLGLNLLASISGADYLIVVDAVRKGQEPGSIYRLKGEDLPKRIVGKSSLHQVDLLEILTLCQALEKAPETVILGVEPEDIETVGLELTSPVQQKLALLVDRVMEELEGLGVVYRPRRSCGGKGPSRTAP